ncbi:right-handed parallel beta-helix repeat-containing protein [bacterium]|nr:right-handed parallel beta-helix repeat-containing protein [bacterium]
MTTPSTSRKAGPLLGTGSQTTWPFTFKVFAATDIAVTIADSLGVETALVYGVDFNVTLNANQETSPGGTVTYPISGAALPVGKRLVIIGNLPYDQPLDLPSGGNFSPLALENQLDRTVMQIQQLRENVGRALQLPVTAAGTLSVQLPQPAPNELIGWDSGGNNLANIPLSDIGTAIAFGTYRYDTFTGNGTTTSFALSEDPAVLANLDVSISGVVQVPGTDYSLATGNLVFTSAPSNGTTILARYGQALTALPDSDQITFVQAGAGASTRTVQNKLRDTVSVQDFGAVGDGVADDTVAIQAAINSITQGTVYFPRGTYLTSANVNLKSNVSLQGDNAKITYTASWADYGVFFIGNNVANIEITGFVFDGLGTFSSVPFPNPYGGGNSVGFTNGQVGIQISNGSTNVKVHHNTFTGLGRGVLFADTTNDEITNNTFLNLGAVAVYAERVTYSTINNNIIRGVLGNLTVAGDTSLASSQFADGVYMYDVQQVTVDDNVIENIIRIGVVLEGASPPLNVNTGVVVSNNTIKNMNSCRGTEYNAAIWSEGGKTKDALIIGNTCINTGAVAGTLSAIGILGANSTILNNYIKDFNGNGIEISTSGEISGNKIDGNNSGIAAANIPAGSTLTIADNKITRSKTQGIEFFQSRGTLFVFGNIIEDNGVTATGIRRSGIIVNRYYNNQKVVISGNTFVSSANEGGTVGQLYSIVGVAGGDFSRTTNWITNNQFIFTGTFSSAYPSNLSVLPNSFAYDNTSGSVFQYEIMPINGNLNSKMVQPPADGFNAGYPYMVGFATAIPVSGTYRQGDYLLNPVQTSGQPFGWVCTTGGTPGTWKIISTVS